MDWDKGIWDNLEGKQQCLVDDDVCLYFQFEKQKKIVADYVTTPAKILWY